LTSGHPTASVIREWLTLLAVCHTVVPERDRDDPDKIVYQAASPDEEALVKAVKALGFSFNARSPSSVTINALGKEEEYEILNVLEFNSTRKRMSVIVRTPTGAIKLYCKGADNVIYDRLAKDKQPFAAATEVHLKRFASDGLRTLCLGVAQLTEADYEAWSAIYKDASRAIFDRAGKIDAAAELVEKDLLLLGASAIEDKLQADVPKTISKLAQAGIKIWVLTGDKQETAINIGFSCKLLRHNMKLLICNEESISGVERWIEKHNQELGFNVSTFEEELGTLALVIDGGSLTFALDPRVADRWLRLARRCKAVICCRVSPLQKADIVRLVRRSTKAITLAIGDGANDVGMIQAAHVGVGISGQEGLQAARAADYAIGQFRFLQKLLLCHGNWSYRRISMLILYFFYKNFSLCMIELYYAFSNAFSGQVLYEKWMIASFNIMFTLFPPLAIGIFDQHLTKETLMAFPQLYKTGQNGTLFNVRTFWTWAANAWFHCTLAYFLVFQALATDVARKDGQTQGQWYVGCIVYAITVYTVTLKAAFVSNFWTWQVHTAIWGSLAIWTLFTLIYFTMWKQGVMGSMAAEVYGVSGQMYGSGVYWLLLILIPVISLFRDFVRCAFLDRCLHSRMPLVSHACSLEASMLRGAYGIPFGLYTTSYRCHRKIRPNAEGVGGLSVQLYAGSK
jgi:phospholipid-transporting ATPase